MTRHATFLTTTLAAVGIVALTVFWRPTPLLVWNASASVPVGLYSVRSTGDLAIASVNVV